jgi:hypothetical protein
MAQSQDGVTNYEDTFHVVTVSINTTSQPLVCSLLCLPPQPPPQLYLFVT